ncbi:MAG: GNAT family N-acetyltransferase [Planctomycetota bacterium]|nr:MAG: GNAT family N-acetyltransferase [Planctomycetota bacterium]REK44749.1 MAG: GNAT family N-acetyltransferase [Planctomycetota bacterium]
MQFRRIMSHVLEINDLESLAAYRLLWHSMLGETEGATFFQSLDWLELYWKHFGPQGSGDVEKLRVLIVHGPEKPIGILPLVVRRESKLIGFREWRTVRTLAYPLHDWGTSYGPLGPNPTATLLVALRHIQETPRDWDVLEFASVEEEHLDRGRTPRALEQVNLTAVDQVHDQAAQIDCRVGWEAYWASRTGKHRNNVRRTERKLAELGQVEYVRYRPEGSACGDDDPRWDLFDICVELSERSWQHQASFGTTMAHESVCDFLRDVHAAAVRQGAVDINLLYLDGRPVAFTYNYHLHGNVFGLRMGFDAELEIDGLGTTLMHRSIRDGFERGDALFDLGPSYLGPKRRWWNRLVTTRRYTHYPALAWKAQTVRFGRQVRSWLKPARLANRLPTASLSKAR